MITTTVTKLPKSKIELKIEVPADEFALFTNKALEEIAKDSELEGFRKGTAPKELVKNRVGQAIIMERAAKLAIEDAYPKAVALEKIEPLGFPEIEILKLAENNPLEFKAMVAVFPAVKLPDYKLVASGFKAIVTEVTKEDIERLKMEKERRERENTRKDLIEAIAKQSIAEVPDVLVANETEKMMADLKEKTTKALNMSFDDYLKNVKKTEAELYQQIYADNDQKIKNYLILQEIAKVENINATDEEIKEAVSKVTDQGGGAAHLKEYYRDALKAEKVFAYLEAFFQKP